MVKYVLRKLKQTLYLSDAYSIQKLKDAYIYEEQTTEAGPKPKSSMEYSLLEIFENIEKFGLHGSELIEPRPPIGRYFINFSNNEIDELLKKLMLN